MLMTNLDTIKYKFKVNSIFLSDEKLLGRPTIIAYEKLFKWKWLATQLNTFILVSDFSDQTINVQLIEKYLSESINFAKQNYKGWPKGLQSGMGVISVLISSDIDATAIEYCRKLKSSNMFKGISVPVTINSETKEIFSFVKNPLWGRLYFPYFKQIISDLK
jgi:hypothetical protein